jgi:phenylalanyl-tRNA synthetase beta chain
VRRATKGDRLTLLDGQEIEPDEDMLLIADHARPLAVAGVMGGADSAVGDSTRDILLESAWFNPATISGKARRLGMSTESAHRFERGVDPELQALAAERATQLIVDIAGGRPGPVVEAVDDDHLPATPTVSLRRSRLNRLLGAELQANQVVELLESLEMTVESDGEGERFLVTAPSARRDIEIEADLIEEVARIYGYDRLPTRHPGGEIIVKAPAERVTEERALRQQLAARGFQEVIAWSFVSQEELDVLSMGQGAQPLANPLSRELAVLRTSLLPGLLSVAGRNLRRQLKSFRLFEAGHCFETTGSGFEESWRIGLLMTGERRAEHFDGPADAIDFYDLKGEVEQLLAFNAVEAPVRYARADRPWLHPGQAADLLIDGAVVGWLGQLHPALSDELDLDQAVFVAEFDGAAVSARRLPQHHDSGRFPAVRRDIALVISDEYPAATILEAIRETAGAQLENCVVFDQYRGQGIETGFRSLAIGLILRDVSRTLKDREVDALLETVLGDLETRFGAKLRG